MSIKKLRITVDGKAYEATVEVLDGLTTVPPAAAAPVVAAAPVKSAPVAAPAGAGSSAARPAVSAGAGDILAPLTGLIVEVKVAVGQEVKAGDPVLVLEAMKMNTVIPAPKAGKIAAINCAKGENVEEGKVLVSIA